MKKLQVLILSLAVIFSACDNKKVIVTPNQIDSLVTIKDTIKYSSDSIPMCQELVLDTNGLRLLTVKGGRRKPRPTPTPTPTPTPITYGKAIVLLVTNGVKATEISYVWSQYAIPDLAPYTGGMTIVLSQLNKLYTGYNVTFTTDEAFYNANSVAGARMRCIITPTSNWYMSGSGVAYVGSMRWVANTGSGIEEAPCFVFSDKLYNNEEWIGDIIAHEVGHTISLSHQGDFDINCVRTAIYGEGFIMGRPFNTSNPTWRNQNICSPFQNDMSLLIANLPK